MTFRQLARRFHPDANGGDRSKTIEFTDLMKHRRNECLCGCGRQRPRNNGKFYNSICGLRYRYPQLKALAAVLLAAVTCLGAGLPPMPPTPPPAKKKALHSPKGKELYLGVPMAIVLPPKKWALFWNYPTPLPDPRIEFSIEARPNFNSPWQTLGVTNRPPWPITTQAPSGMYRVGAHWK